MRITILPLLLFIAFTYSVNAQFLHTPSEIETIKNESIISYQLDSLLSSPVDIQYTVLSFPFDDHFHQNSVSFEPTFIQTDNQGKKSLKKADNYYLNKKYAQAIDAYLKIDELGQFPEAMIRMADCYQKLALPDNAISLYQSLVEKDSSNAFLHFQLANCYRQKGEHKKACYQITLAHLYNRNNRVYIDSLVSIYHNMNWTFRVLDFNPEYEIKQTSDSLIHIYTSEKPWAAYASCKAIWSYEPGYQEKMSYISTAESRIIEEKECLFNALVVYEQLEVTDKINYPALYTLSKALPDKRVDDFIMYEISARKHPEIIGQLSKERVTQLVDYVFTYRVKTPDNPH